MRLVRKYRKIFYFIFFTLQFASVSWGLGSGDRLYRLIFGISMPFLLLAAFGGEYTKAEWGRICFIIFLAAWAYLQNGSRSLILSFMAVAGAKNMDVKKILKASFWILLVCMTVKISLCILGILQNEAFFLPKENGIWHTIYSYGYASPNNLYFHLMMAVLLGAAVYGERAGAFVVAVVTAAMYIWYEVLMCRTGWFCYLFFLILYILCRIARQKGWIRLRQFLDIGMVGSYGMLAALNWGMVFAYAKGMGWMKRINTLMNNRFGWALTAFESTGFSFLGGRGAGQLDMLYSSMLVNYGILTTGLFIGAHIKAMWVLHKEREYLVLACMTAVALYSFMEVNAVNLMWNPFLLYLTIPLFEGDKNAQNTEILL